MRFSVGLGEVEVDLRRAESAGKLVSLLGNVDSIVFQVDSVFEFCLETGCLSIDFEEFRVGWVTFKTSGR